MISHVVRYNSNGSLDTLFDADGKRIDNIGDMGGDAKSLAIQKDGKIVVAGSSSLDFALFRSNSDGSADTSFDGDGRVTTDIGTVDEGLAVALQADNKIVVAGFSISRSFNPSRSHATIPMAHSILLLTATE